MRGRLLRMDRFEIHIHMDETVPTIRVTGEFDLEATEPFRAEAAKLLVDQRELVVVDLRDLTFLDSTGLTELIRLYKQAEELGFRLAILRPPPNVAVLFELTGLDQHLPLYDPDEPLTHTPRRG